MPSEATTPIADPNVLFATIVQASAAIVAIIAGLITATLLQLAVERNSLLSRITEREREVERFKQEKHIALAEAHQLRARFVLMDRISEILMLDPMPTAEQLQRRLQSGFIPVDIFAVEWQKLCREIEGVRSELHRVMQLFSPRNQSFDEWLFENTPTIHIPDGSEWLAGKVFNHLCNRPLSTQLPLVGPQEQDEMIDSYETRASDLERIIRTSNSELEHLRDRLKIPSDPKYLVPGMMVLGYVTVTGVIIPLLFMPLSPSQYTSAHKWWTIGLFLSGLVALFMYIGTLIRAR